MEQGADATKMCYTKTMSYQSDDERLSLAVQRARIRFPQGIGTQSEKLVHCALKYYLEPDESCHEVRVRGQKKDGTSYSHVADIFQKERGHIYEIQTRAFDRLRIKLADFLEDYTVTVVYPIPHIKYISWVDPETGEASDRHRSPKTGRFSDILPEIYHLPDIQMHPNLEFLAVLLDLDEYRFLDGWSKDRKRGSHRMERLPVSIAGMEVLKRAEDYASLIPADLPDPFFRTELMKALKLSGRKGSGALSVLTRAGVMEHIGQIDRKYIYSRKENHT